MKSIKAETATDKLVKLQLFYREHPIEFVQHMFGVEPTEQQKDLILEAVSPNARVAVKSCTSSGKTATLSWLTYYFLICFPNCRGLVTAPTASQLFRVFRSELVLWHTRMNPVFADMFEIMSEKVFVKGRKDTQYCSWVTGSADNKESFAGLHADKVFLFVDEASALPSEIFDTLYGTLSFGDTSFCLVSNPVRAEGSFYNIFQIPDDKSVWSRLTFDAFGSPNVDKDWIEEMRSYYGEDSDFWKMRVLGEFPLMSEAQFIAVDLVDRAVNNVVMQPDYIHHPRVMGCDVARFGSDCSVIVDRQGPKIHNILSFKGIDTVSFSEKILAYYNSNQRQFSCIAIDGMGVGGGVVDNLKRFDLPIMEVTASGTAPDFKTYANVRAQLWGEMKHWLAYADLPNNQELRDSLVAINYGFNNKMQILLEAKKEMKKRGKASPDIPDALSFTFAPEIFSFMSKKKKPRHILKARYTWV